MPRRNVAVAGGIFTVLSNASSLRSNVKLFGNAVCVDVVNHSSCKNHSSVERMYEEVNGRKKKSGCSGMFTLQKDKKVESVVYILNE